VRSCAASQFSPPPALSPGHAELMVLGIIGALYTSYFPTQYAVQIAIGLLVIYVLRTLSQGRRTNRERDLHARVVLVTVCPSSSHIPNFC
jgi:hypothetical protein